jgi:hypothetical protein
MVRQADEKSRSRMPLGPLHGIGGKDIVETQGIPTTMGSEIFHGFVPAAIGHLSAPDLRTTASSPLLTGVTKNSDGPGGSPTVFDSATAGSHRGVTSRKRLCPG